MPPSAHTPPFRRPDTSSLGDVAGDIRNGLDPMPARWLIGIPRLSETHLSRPRLLESLDDDSSALRVVEAPAGYGKTALLAEWARRRHEDRKESVLWMSLQAPVTQASAFWTRVVELLETASPGRRASGESRADDASVRNTEHRREDSEQRIGDLGDAARYTELLRRFGALRGPVTLLIDDYQLLGGGPVEPELLRVLRHAENLRLVVGTRTRSIAGSSSSALSVDTTRITASMLEFRPQETAALAGLLGLPPAPWRIEEVQRESGGWPRAVLAVLRYGVDAQGAGMSTDTGYGEVVRALFGEVCALPGAEYLKIISVVEAVTPELARALGAPEESSVLDDVEARGLGAWEGDRRQGSFRLLPLLRETLQSTLPPERHREIQRRLASWYERQHDHPAAFRAALRADDWAAADRYARFSFSEICYLVLDNPMLTSRVPYSAMRFHVVLGLMCGLASYVAGNPEMSRLTLHAVVEHQVRRDSSGVDYVWAQAVRLLGMRLAGHYEQIRPAIRKLHELLTLADDPDGELRRAEEAFKTEAARTHVYLDHMEDAKRALAIPTGPRRGHRAGISATTALAAYVHATSGEIIAARAIAGSAPPPDAASPRLSSVPLHLALATIALEDNRPEEAWTQLHPGGAPIPDMEHWPLVLHAQTLACWYLNGAAEAIHLVEAGIAERNGRPPISNAMTAMLVALRADLMVSLDRLGDARDLVRARAVGSFPRLAVVRARMLMLSGQIDEAFAVTDRFRHRRMTPRTRLTMLLIGASSALRAGDEPDASRRFRRAVEMSGETGLLTPFAMMPRQDFRRLIGVPAAGVSPIDYKRLGMRVDPFPILVPDPGGLVVLSSKELGVLRVLATVDSTRDVAQRLSVSVNTVKTHRRMIYRKLGVSSRAEAVAEAKRRGMLG